MLLLCEQLIQNDKEFLKIDNRVILHDSNLDIINNFFENRRLLLNNFANFIQSEEINNDIKEQCFSAIKQSSVLIEDKIRKIQKEIKLDNLNLSNYKKAYATYPAGQGYFVDKLG